MPVDKLNRKTSVNTGTNDSVWCGNFQTARV